MRRSVYIISSLLFSATGLLNSPFIGTAAAFNLSSPELISKAPDGTPGNSASFAPVVSPDGRYVVFSSSATNLTPDSVPSSETVTSVSPPLTWIQQGVDQTYLYDRQNHTMQLLSKTIAGDAGDHDSTPVAISSDNRYVLFNSGATNFPGYHDENNFGYPSTGFVYLKDLQANTLTMVSDPSFLTDRATSMSDDAKLVVHFAGTSVNIDGNLNTSNTTLLLNLSTNTDLPLPASTVNPKVSHNGQYLSYQATDTNSQSGQYLYNVSSGQSTQILQDYPRIGSIQFNADDSRAVFANSAGLYISDLTTGSTTLIGANTSTTNYFVRSMSANGRVISFDEGFKVSWVMDLVSGQQSQLGVGNRSFSQATLNSNGSLVAYIFFPPKSTGSIQNQQVYVAPIVSDLAAPTGLTAPTPTNNAPVLTWDAVAGATSYQIWREDTLTGINIQIGTSTSANFTDTYNTGVYNYTVVAVNDSTQSVPSSPFQVAVTNTTATTARNIMAQGQSEVIPVSGNDVLPGLASGSTSKASFDFNLGYPGGNFAVTRPLTLTFNAGGHNLFLSSTSIDWMVVSGENNSTGTFQGQADVSLDGVMSSQPFTVTATDGALTSPTSAGNFKLTVYANNSRSTTLYSISESLNRGKIKIN
jgi:hypothetical protein